MIQGTEHEYTLFNRRLEDLGVDPHRVALGLLRESDLHAAGEFTTNQSRAYFDVGHLEISCPEVTNPRDLIIWEKAGEKIVDWLRKKVEEKHLPAGERILALKNNTAPDGTSYGSHENYAVPRSLDFPDRYLRELVPHFVTRMAYTGAGDILDGRFVLSPTLYKTSHMISNNTMHGTGLLNTRDEPHADPDSYRRLHVIVGDALLHEPAILLRHFTTQGVLQCMVDGTLGDVPDLAHPLEDMWRAVEATNPDRWTFQLRNGGTTTLMEVQRYYLAKIEPLVATDLERTAFRLWEHTLDQLERKRTQELARTIEWVDRYLAIQEQKRKKPDDPEIEMRACKYYSEVGEDRGLYYQRQRKGLADRVVSNAEIQKAIHAPPVDTRANLRREICDAEQVTAIDWSRVTVRRGDGVHTFVLDSPFEVHRSATTVLVAGGG